MDREQDLPMTSVSSTAAVSPWNVPNLLTSIRLLLAVAVIALIAVDWYLWAFVAFVVAASTDWMDGYWARRFGQVTKLGRIFDPFVDKIVICGAFIALVEVSDSSIAAWMAIVVVARELLVTSLRGLIEGAGGDFSASQFGKWKMVLQCVAVGAVLLCLMEIDFSPAMQWLGTALLWIRDISVWGAVLLTVYSGYDYVVAATRIMSTDEPAR